MNYYVQVFKIFFPEEKSPCVRFLACLSGLCLLALNTFAKCKKEGGRLYVGPRRPGLGASRCLLSLLPHWVDAFPLCDVANRLPGVGWFPAGVILLDGKSLEVWSEVFMAWEELCDLVIQLDPFVSHIWEIFIGGSSPWRTLPPFIQCIHDSICDSSAQGFGCVEKAYCTVCQTGMLNLVAPLVFFERRRLLTGIRFHLLPSFHHHPTLHNTITLHKHLHIVTLTSTFYSTLFRYSSQT